MDEKLKDIFSNINDWLKFAEAKSATLIAGNGALIFGISRLANTYDVTGLLWGYLVFSVILCITSMAICLISVIPSLCMPWEVKPEGISNKDNLLYFSDIAKYTPLDYLKALEKSLGLEGSEFTGYQKSLSSQIIVNSVIAHRKYRNFKTAAWLTLAALISPILALLIYSVRKD